MYIRLSFLSLLYFSFLDGDPTEFDNNSYHQAIINNPSY